VGIVWAGVVKHQDISYDTPDMTKSLRIPRSGEARGLRTVWFVEEPQFRVCRKSEASTLVRVEDGELHQPHRPLACSIYSIPFAYAQVENSDFSHLAAPLNTDLESLKP
jgi:hypothetical protein